MEHAPLRPIPARPGGPLDPVATAAAVSAALPELSERAAHVFALVALAGIPRQEIAMRLGVADEELAAELAAARKALRRSVVQLPGSGWCERAERLISDRLDGPLDPTGAARLDVHLRNCPRCVEHERRLVQATDGLVQRLPAAAPAERPRAAPEPPPDASPVEPPPDVAPEVPAEPPPEAPAAMRAPAPTPPTPVTVVPSEPEAPPRRAGEVDVSTVQTVVARARAAAWYLLLVLAVILAVASLALTVAGVLGAEL